jgi:hypothetical protein
MSLRARMSAGGPAVRWLRLFAALTAVAIAASAWALTAAGQARTAAGQARTAAGKPKTTGSRSAGHTPVTAAVPPGFVGVDTDGPLFDASTSIDFGNQLDSMVANGVESIRVAFSWSAGQPYSGWGSVPADQKAKFVTAAGRPTSFQDTDTIVGDAARRHITVLPTVLYAPSWDATNNPNGVPYPDRAAPYASYLTALIGRYGPHGTFWSEFPDIPKLPIRTWQIWNEPNLSYYWKQPFASSYVSLLRLAHSAVKHADPGAQVVLGALTNLAWKSLGQVYKAGGRSSFDIASVNGFTQDPANVILYLRFMRNAMSRFGDRLKPLIATELSWPSARGQTKVQFNFDTTEAGQARNIATLLPLLGQQRVSLGLTAFYYYTWMGAESQGNTAFDFAGLLRFHDGQVTAKPALGAFRKGALALEQCRRKGAVATSCIK